ncbi:MAG: adenylyl-sulfate kinase [Verrucomicrobiota bacterium]
MKSTNILWNDFEISKQAREDRNGHKGACIWLTGLSCSGKTTIASELQVRLFKAGCHTYILDGDNIRHGLNKNLGFSPEDRTENISRIGHVAKLFAEAGVLVIAAFISPYRKDRDSVRKEFTKGDFIEVFINTPLSVCEQRDTKSLYKKARAGEIKEFTGVSAPYEYPENPELIVETENKSKEESVETIMRYLFEKNYLTEEYLNSHPDAK